MDKTEGSIYTGDYSKLELRELATRLPLMYWRPIAELEDLYQQPLWVASPKLVDLDTNQVGVSDGFWQDATEFEGMSEEDALYAADGGYWVVRGWDMCNDEFTTVKLRKDDVTHFLIPISPYEVIENPQREDFGVVYLDGVRVDG